MQTWRATVSLCSNSADILRGASSSTCQETTTTKPTPWHESALPAKQYLQAWLSSAFSSHQSSPRQIQIQSLCRLPLKKSDPAPKPKQMTQRPMRTTPKAAQSDSARGLQNSARGLQNSARGLQQSSEQLRTPARRLPARPSASKSRL